MWRCSACANTWTSCTFFNRFSIFPAIKFYWHFLGTNNIIRHRSFFNIIGFAFCHLIVLGATRPPIFFWKTVLYMDFTSIFNLFNVFIMYFVSILYLKLNRQSMWATCRNLTWWISFSEWLSCHNFKVEILVLVQRAGRAVSFYEWKYVRCKL